jgi:hypothetical protein
MVAQALPSIITEHPEGRRAVVVGSIHAPHQLNEFRLDNFLYYVMAHHHLTRTHVSVDRQDLGGV